jgi:apyrase
MTVEQRAAADVLCGWQVGLVGEDAISGQTTPAALGQAAARACAASSAAEVEALFPSAEGDYLCLDLTFQHALLTVGFGMADHAKLTLVKRVAYQGTEIEAAWPLGAAINSLG